MKEINLLENFRFLYLYDFNIKNTPIVSNYPHISIFFIEGDPNNYENITKAYTLMIGLFEERIRTDEEGNERPFYTKFLGTIKASLEQFDLYSAPEAPTKRIYSYSENKFLLFDIYDVVECTFWEWLHKINYDKLAEYILKLKMKNTFYTDISLIYVKS